MPFVFDVNKATHALLFLISSLGGKVDVYNLAAILYLADVKYLSKYGTLILGETYVAFKGGPMPFHFFCIYMQLKDANNFTILRYNLSDYFIVNDNEIISLTNYDGDYLSENEVAVLFETIQENKNIEWYELILKAQNAAWQDTGVSSEIPLSKVAASSGASKEMLAFIEKNIQNELYSFTRKK
jgi:hypothetical protein